MSPFCPVCAAQREIPILKICTLTYIQKEKVPQRPNIFTQQSIFVIYWLESFAKSWKHLADTESALPIVTKQIVFKKRELTEKVVY